MNSKKIEVEVQRASSADQADIVALDAEITGSEKTAYWTDILKRFAAANQHKQRYFLVARSTDDELLGFIVGEIRAWEFGSPPCGWVLAMGVSPQRRERGIGELLLDALCTQIKKSGVTTIRTMVLGSDKVNLSFFRGEGLAAGPYIELEKHLD